MLTMMNSYKKLKIFTIASLFLFIFNFIISLDHHHFDEHDHDFTNELSCLTCNMSTVACDTTLNKFTLTTLLYVGTENRFNQSLLSKDLNTFIYSRAPPFKNT